MKFKTVEEIWQPSNVIVSFSNLFTFKLNLPLDDRLASIWGGGGGMVCTVVTLVSANLNCEFVWLQVRKACPVTASDINTGGCMLY